MGGGLQVQRQRLTSIDVLLVGKDKQKCILHFSILDDARQLGAGLLHAVTVVAVDNENQALGA